MLKFAPLFGSGCVLALGRELRIFGECDTDHVGVMLQAPDGHVLSAGCAHTEQGRFMALLPAVDAPHTGCRLCAVAGDADHEETIASEQVAVGLLFLAGGQSNMELELQNADEGKQLIESHSDPELRYFNVPKKAVWNEEAMQAEAWSHWESIRPGYGRDMSAVAYFFAMRLRRAYGADMPIGIIDCYWGGTSIACWMDEEALDRTAEGQRYRALWNEQSGGKTLAQFQQEWDAFQAEMDEWNQKCAAIRARDPQVQWEELIAEAGYCPWHPPIGPGSPYRPAGLCETMLKRITPAALNAVLYYQAEEDAWRTTCYDQLMMQLVLRWRELFQAMDLPFLYMQLPMWIDKGVQDDGTWARTRMAQKRASQMIAKSAMCCLIDCGELDNIHPTDKRTPGERLACTWLRMQHDAAHPMQYPLTPEARDKSTDGHALVIRLTAPVALRDGEAELFEIAAADGPFVPARAQLVDAMTLRLTAEGLKAPVKARYAYKAFAKVHLFGTACRVWSPAEGEIVLDGRQAVPLAPFELL